MNDLADWVLKELKPDLTILLDAPVDIAMTRTDRRGDHDRLDVEKHEFYERVRKAYLDLAAGEPERFAVVDASGTLEQVSAELDAVADSLFSDS